MATFQRSVVVSVLFTLLGGPGILLVLVPWLLTRFRIPPEWPAEHVFAGSALILLGMAPLFESMFRFIFAGHGTLAPGVPTEHLVVSGLYRFVRNPMYIGVLISIAGETVLFWTRGMLLELLAAWLGFHLFVRYYEEPRLLRMFSMEYLRYRKNVPRWIPRLTPWKAEKRVSVHSRLDAPVPGPRTGKSGSGARFRNLS